MQLRLLSALSHLEPILKAQVNARDSRLGNRIWDVYEDIPDQPLVFQRLQAATGIVPFTGWPGSGKTTVLRRFLERELGQAVEDGEARVGYVLIDFRLKKRLPTNEEGMVSCIRKYTISSFFPTAEELDRLDHGIRGLLTNQSRSRMDSAERVELQSAFDATDDAIERLAGRRRMTNVERDVIILEHPKLSPHIRKLRQSIPIYHLFRIAKKAFGLSKIFLVMDNVDELDHALQSQYFNILHGLHSHLGDAVPCIVAIRPENLHAKKKGRSRTDRNSFITVIRLAGDRDIEMRVSLPLLLDYGFRDDRNVMESSQKVRNIVLRRVRLAKQLVPAIRRERADFALLESLIEPILDVYVHHSVGMQFDAVANRNCRLFLESIVNFLDFLIRNSSPPIQDLLAQPPEQQRELIASLLYRWLRSEAPQHGILTHDLVELYKETCSTPADAVGPGPVKCFTKHLILAYLRNRLMDMDRDFFQFLRVKDLAKALEGLRQESELSKHLFDLFSDGRVNGQLIEIRSSQGRIIESATDINDNDAVWITPRGDQSVVRFPYKFHSILAGLDRLRQKGAAGASDLYREEPATQAEAVLEFVRRLMNLHLEGLEQVTWRYAGKFGTSDRCIQEYRRRFGVRVRDRRDNSPTRGNFVQLLQMERIFFDVGEFLSRRNMPNEFLARLRRLEAHFQTQLRTLAKKREWQPAAREPGASTILDSLWEDAD